jgi:hypothetical protein
VTYGNAQHVSNAIYTVAQAPDKYHHFCLPLLRVHAAYVTAAPGPAQAGEGLQLLDWSVSAKAQLKSWDAYDMVAPRVRVYYRGIEKNFKVRHAVEANKHTWLRALTGIAVIMPVW